MDPTLTALSAVFFLLSLALFAYAWKARRQELAAVAHEPVIDLRDRAVAPADDGARQRV